MWLTQEEENIHANGIDKIFHLFERYNIVQVESTFINGIFGHDNVFVV